MPKIALFVATAVFTAIALILAALYVFDTDVILGGSLTTSMSACAKGAVKKTPSIGLAAVC